MIIDSHIHHGCVGKFIMPIEYVYEALSSFNIQKALISNAEAIEWGNDDDPVFVVSQIDANIETLRICRESKGVLYSLFWCKPYEETCDILTQKLILENLDIIKGLKFHPFHSHTKITDPKCEPYLIFANQHKLPVAVHTAFDKYSRCQYLKEVADKYPEIPFIAVHMDLGTDHKEATELIATTKNLYGDTTWINDGKKVESIIKRTGANKILFGSDAPIDGPKTYEAYREMYNYLKITLSNDDFNAIFCTNSIKMFGL